MLFKKVHIEFLYITQVLVIIYLSNVLFYSKIPVLYIMYFVLLYFIDVVSHEIKMGVTNLLDSVNKSNMTLQCVC